MIEDYSNVNAIIYIIVWLITYYVYCNKTKSFNVVSLILLTELILSILSMLLYVSPLSSYNTLKLFPFIYLYSLILISIIPLMKVPFDRIQSVQKPSDLILNFFCICFITAAFLQIPSTILHFREGLVRMLLDVSLGSELYSERIADSGLVGDGAISNLPSIITNTFGDIAIFISLYYVSLKKKSKMFTIGLMISILVILIQPISRGLRGPTVLRFISIIIAYIILYRFYDANLNNRIKKILFICLITISIPVATVTISRFAERDGGSLYSLTSYLGQANLNFNNYALDANGIRYGDRTANLFKSIVVDNVPRNYVERRDKYHYMKISDEVYSTYVGDIVLDYGPIITPIIFIIISIIISKICRNKRSVIPFHKLFMIYFVSCIVMQGSFYLFPYSDIGGNLTLIAYFLMYIVFRFDYKQRFNRVWPV